MMKFSIRDLFLVTVIVALMLGWWADRIRLATSVEELKLEKVRFVLRSHSELSRGLIVAPNPSARAPNPPKP
jgi:hypothetical protein